MNIEIADVVIPINGRDKGKSFLVIAIENEFSKIADGKGRRLEKPKLKKNKHLRLEGKNIGQITEKLCSGEKITNKELRKALAQYAACREKGGM